MPAPSAPPSAPGRSPTACLLEPRDACALIWNDTRIDYVDVLRRAFDLSSRMPEPGSRVVVFSENSLTWVFCAYAIWTAGAVLVPVDHLSTAQELAYVLNDCEPAMVLCSRALLATAESALDMGHHRPRTVVMDELEFPLRDMGGRGIPHALTVDESVLAAIVYTSGTTGDPKGAMLSFGNLLTNVRAVVNAGYFTPRARVLLLLPLHHVLPLAGSLVAPLFGGSTVVFATSMAGDELVQTLRRHAITTIVGVPRLYDRLHGALRERIQANPVARRLYALARRVRSRSLSRVLFSSVHRRFGGALEHLVCGGAALSPETAETFDVLGFRMCEGYGMTECAPMITFPRPEAIELGSCGQVLDGCEIRIADGGEILVRGPNVMLGYYRRPEETTAILRDGWLHTGDLGRIDERGNLHVIGRLKEILVLPNGKNVNPNSVEEALAAHPAVKEAGVFLDEDALHVLIVPNWDQLPILDRYDAEEWLRHEVLETYNVNVSRYRQVARLTLVAEDLPRTRLGKLKRHLLRGVAEQAWKTGSKTESDELDPNGAAARLTAFLGRLCRRPVDITSRLSADLALDSLGRVELSVFVERTFGLPIPETRLIEVETVGDLARFVEQNGNADGERSTELSWAEILNPKNPPSLPRSTLYHRAIVYLSRALVHLLFRVTVQGREPLPGVPFILVANHQSFLDGLFVTATMNVRAVLNTLFYAKEQHVRKRWLKALAQRSNTVVVDPKRGILRSLQQLATALRHGRNLIIFPEGTRSTDGSLAPFKDSYAILASELHAPVVPVAIDGAYRVMPRGRRLPKLRGRISVTYLPAMKPGAGESAVHFNRRVQELVAEALAQGRATASVSPS